MKRKELEKDAEDLENKIQKAQAYLKRLSVEIIKWSGALAYIKDNLKEEEDDRRKFNRKKPEQTS